MTASGRRSRVGETSDKLPLGMARVPIGVLDFESTSATLTVSVPFVLRRRGARKLIALEAVAESELQAPEVDGALVAALARAFRWQSMLQSGQYGSLTEISKAEKIDKGYVSRALDLTLLAPDIVESVLDGTSERGLTLGDLRAATHERHWELQRRSMVSAAQRDTSA
jgi:hypothetical protein